MSEPDELSPHDELSPQDMLAVAGGQQQHVAVRAVLDALDNLERQVRDQRSPPDLTFQMMQMMMARRG
jgi:hypothetical protein